MPRYRPGASRSTVSSRTGAISENSVVFSSAGGHSHDGSNSSLIDTTKYSVWDFPVNTVYSTNPRASRQNAHIDQFRSFITNHVADNVLGPAGVTLRDNIINANNIIAGSITTDLLATNAITSLNYVYSSGDYSDSGTSLDLSTGLFRSENFAITADGDGKFKGELQAAGGSLASFKITSEALLTSGFVSGTTIEVADGSTSNTYSTTGAVKIFNYGDIFVQSKPASGPHAGQYHQTEIAGEYINIQEWTTDDFATGNSALRFTFIGALGDSSSSILGPDEHKVLVRSNEHYSVALANDNGSLVGARQLDDNDAGPYSRADLQSYNDTPKFELNRRDDYTNSNSAFRSVYAEANSSNAYIELKDGTLSSSEVLVTMRTLDGGSIRVGSSSKNYIYLYTQQNTAKIADTFAGNTDKSYIYFNSASGSNDPGFILHETRGVTETNEGVLHLCPSDDNAYGDYVSIHGTDESDKIKLHTDGQIDGVTTLTATTVSATTVSATSMTATGQIQAEHFYSTDDAQIGDSTEYVYINSDSNNQLQLISNTASGRPYLSFANQNAVGDLVTKAYIGYPDANSSAGTGLNIYTYDGDISIDPNVNLQIYGKTYFRTGNDVSLTANSGYVLIGNPSSSHIAIDDNEIMAKSNGTTATTLYLNNNGGTVRVGSGVLQLGTTDVRDIFYGGSTNNAGKRIFIQSGQPSGGVNGDIWIKP